MSIFVPRYPPLLFRSTDVAHTSNRIRNGAAVSSVTWSDMAAAINYLRGHGGTVVCGTCTNYYDTTGVVSMGFRAYWHAPSNQDVELGYDQGRVWFVVLKNRTETLVPYEFSVTFLDSSVTRTGMMDSTASASVPSDRQAFMFLETPTADLSVSGEQIGFDITSSVTAGLAIQYVFCAHIPMVFLQPLDGIDLSTMESGQPIYFPTNGASSAGAVPLFLETDSGRRPSLFNWYNDSPTNITTGPVGWENLFRVDPSVMNRSFGDGAITSDVSYALLAQGNGGNGEIRVSNTFGDTDTQTIGSSLAWVTGALAVVSDECSRYDTDGGLSSGLRDELTVEIRKTTATSIDCYGFCVGDG